MSSQPSLHRSYAGERPAPLDIDLATPEPIPAEGIEAALELLRSGRLFRYVEAGGAPSETAAWEQEFAAHLGRRYAVAVSSCGAALYLALHALQVQPGDPVLVNSWTLSPVPGAVAHAGARPVLVETTAALTVDLEDLERQAADHPGAVLLLSHMRGHIPDLPAVTAVCRRYGLRLVEDCAHSLGGGWDGRPTGTFGAVGCFSTQTYKHLNSGEGGVLVTDDDDVAARAILASGSYWLYGQHSSRPPLELLDALSAVEPNHSMRLTNLAGAVLRPQLRSLAERVAAWNARYALLADGLAGLAGLRVPDRPAPEEFVGSSLQFFLDLPAPGITRFCAEADALGVHVKWFGAPRPDAFTSAYHDWQYAGPASLPGTDAVLAGLCDIRVPLALPLDRCADVVAILRHCLTHALTAPTKEN